MTQAVDVIDVARDSGLRSFDWLHRACESLLCGRGHKYLREVHVNDPAIRDYHLFLKLRGYRAPRRRLPPDHGQLRPILDKFKGAYLLQYRAEHRTLRSELRARILTDQPRDAIAMATGLPMYLIENYERYYFDVRDKLSATAYILGMMAAKPDQGCDADELQRLAYGGGLQVLEAVLTAERSQNLQWQALLASELHEQLEHNPSLRRLMDGSQPAAGAMKELVATLLGPGAAGLISPARTHGLGPNVQSEPQPLYQSPPQLGNLANHGADLAVAMAHALIDAGSRQVA